MATRPQIEIKLTETKVFETMLFDTRELFEIIEDIKTKLEFETGNRIDKNYLTDILTDGRLDKIKNHYNMEN